MFADLHIHSNSSDGTWDNSEILGIVKQKNIDLFSVIDHDILGNSIKMLNELDDYTGLYIHGAEITAAYKNITYHIATYNFDYNDEALDKLLSRNREIWENFNNEFIRLYSKENSSIDCIEHKEYMHTPGKGGWKTLNYLLEKNVLTEIPVFFKMAKPLINLLTYPTPEKVIKIVKNAGGFSFLAHPNAYNNRKVLPEKSLKEWIDFGISGIEAYSPYCTKNDSKYYTTFCNENNLQISGGSDCHGKLLPSRAIGSPVITKEMLKLGFI